MMIPQENKSTILYFIVHFNENCGLKAYTHIVPKHIIISLNNNMDNLDYTIQNILENNRESIFIVEDERNKKALFIYLSKENIWAIANKIVKHFYLLERNNDLFYYCNLDRVLGNKRDVVKQNDRNIIIYNEKQYVDLITINVDPKISVYTLLFSKGDKMCIGFGKIIRKVNKYSDIESIQVILKSKSPEKGDYKSYTDEIFITNNMINT